MFQKVIELILLFIHKFNSMKPLTIFLLSISTLSFANAQEANSGDYYYQIPASPTEYTATNVVARMVDGLGFRYYWASEGLRPEDLAFKPNEEARTLEETIDHILGLSTVIINSVTDTPNIRSANVVEMTYEEKRAKTLDNIKRSSEILKKSSTKDLENFNLVFQNQKNTTEYPFWNQINGPIEDAVWHSGQIVSLRRTAGNPFDSKVSLLRGKRRE